MERSVSVRFGEPSLCRVSANASFPERDKEHAWASLSLAYVGKSYIINTNTTQGGGVQHTILYYTTLHYTTLYTILYCTIT